MDAKKKKGRKERKIPSKNARYTRFIGVQGQGLGGDTNP